MVMKKATTPLPTTRVSRSRRLGVAETKARLSEVLRGLEQSPVVIHSRGRDVGVLVDIGTYTRIAEAGHPPAGGAAFLAAVAALRDRFRGGVEGFAPAPAQLKPQQAFPARLR